MSQAPGHTRGGPHPLRLVGLRLQRGHRPAPATQPGRPRRGAGPRVLSVPGRGKDRMMASGARTALCARQPDSSWRPGQLPHGAFTSPGTNAQRFPFTARLCLPQPPKACVWGLLREWTPPPGAAHPTGVLLPPLRTQGLRAARKECLALYSARLFIFRSYTESRARRAKSPWSLEDSFPRTQNKSLTSDVLPNP